MVKLIQFLKRIMLDISSDTIINALIASGIVGVVSLAASSYAIRAYDQLDKTIGVDKYVGRTPSILEKMQVVGMRGYAETQTGDHPYRLVAEPFDYEPGLKVTRRVKDGHESPSVATSKKAPIVIGTIRMGFGHHRLAYGTASWAIGSDKQRDVYFHDIVGIRSSEAELIDGAETLYSLASRLATEGPGFVERLWGSMTKGNGGNDQALRMQCRTAEMLTSLVDGLDKDAPLIATHPLVGAIAVAAGFKNVINLCVDNHAQWFLVVPGALNLVQGPALYQELLKMGVPDAELELAGHWCHKDLVDGIESATKRRTARAQNGKPIRLLIPVGGAGAQKGYLTSLVKECAPLVKAGQLQLFLNAGDHEHIDKAFTKTLKECGLTYDKVTTVEDLQSFKKHLDVEKNEPYQSVTLFAYNDTYPAVSTTDTLCNVADVLVCKPSELAFYPIPKLMIRRVGDHERKGAIRAVEVGDGTYEARSIRQAMKNIDQFVNNPSVLTTMNKAIADNNQIGMYDGCKVAVQRALERAEQMK